MTNRNAKVEDVRALIDEYMDAGEALDRNELRVERLLAELRTLDEESTALIDRQSVITSHLAPLFEGEGHVVGAFRGDESFAVSHEPDEAFLTVRPLRPVGSLVKGDDDARPRMFGDSEIAEAAAHAAFGDVISLPGRQATIYSGVAVVDQEAG